MKNLLGKINLFGTEHINKIILSILILGIPLWGYAFFTVFSYWTEVHQLFYLFLFFFSIFILSGKNPSPNIVLLALFLSIFPLSRDVLELGANWFFYDSPFIDYLKNIAAKDISVFIAILMVFLIFWALAKTIIQFIQKKRFLNSFFTLLVLSSVIFITVLVHYSVIQFGYLSTIKNEKDHMVQTFNIIDEADFLKSCMSQNYECHTETTYEDLTNQTTDPDFKKFLQNAKWDNPNILKSGSFTIVYPHKIYLILSYQDKWLIESKKAEQMFLKSESVLLSLLTFAHGFWTLFFVWLTIFHQRKKVKI